MSFSDRKSSTKVDVFVVLMLAIMACVVSLRGSSLVPNIVYNIHGDDLWFDADIEDYFNIMTNRLDVVHSNTHRHPLFSIMGYPPVYLIKSLFGTEPLTAVKIVIAGACIGLEWYSFLPFESYWMSPL